MRSKSWEESPTAPPKLPTRSNKGSRISGPTQPQESGAGPWPCSFFTGDPDSARTAAMERNERRPPGFMSWQARDFNVWPPGNECPTVEPNAALGRLISMGDVGLQKGDFRCELSLPPR